jgi:hypothetical protein
MSALPHLALSSPDNTTAELDSTAAPTQTSAKPHAESQDHRHIHVASRKIPPGLLLPRSANTPPASPTSTHPSRMGIQEPRSVHDSGALTPPATPISASHPKSDSTSSDLLSTSASHIRVDSASSQTHPFQTSTLVESLTQPGRVEVVPFPYQSLDYQIKVDDNQKKKLIGTGVWSDVYLATPTPAKPTSQTLSARSDDLTLRDSDTRVGKSVPPGLYAVKVPASRSARKVLTEEARILSYLARFPDSSQHVVRFFGQDLRTDALVLEAMDGTLESWIQRSLNVLSEPERAEKLSAVFPSLALSLIDSLRWMQSKSCTHADIKPGNILTCPPMTSTCSVPKTVYSDFSSSTLHILPSEASPSPLGAGTWDYLDPSLLSSATPATPSAATDLWSLAITFLYFIVGASPFDALKGNPFQQREMIKQGAPLACLGYGDEGMRNMRRLRGLEGALGFSLVDWLGKVFVKDVKKRVGVDAWREEFVRGVKEKGAMR